MKIVAGLLALMLLPGCACNFRSAAFEGIWRMDKEHEVKFEKTRRICMNLAKSVGGAGRLFVIGCKPKWMLEQQDEVYIDCMEQRGYKYLGLESDKAK